MASISNFRGGYVNFIALPTANDGAVAHAIEVGDLVGVTSGIAYPASHYATAAAFRAAFVGVAFQKIGLQTGEKTFHLTDDPGWILVAKSGRFAFSCASGISWLPNSFVNVYVTGGACVNQQVALGTDTVAIGIVSLPYSNLGVTTLTEVVVDIKSVYSHDAIASGS